MHYLKNSEVARLYGVSKATVGNWIKSARKLGLEVVTHNSKKVITNTPHNKVLLLNLSNNGRKYKHKNKVIKVTPTPFFYDLFNKTQLIDIITNLEINREIPHKYKYFNGGANLWDEYVKKTVRESLKNTVTNTHELLNLNKDYIFSYLHQKKCGINFVDIGIGNAYPVRDLLHDFIKFGFLRKYYALDISPIMIDIAEENLKNWFGKDLHYETQLIDISYDLIRDLLFENSQYFENENAINLVFFIGSTIENLEDPHRSLQNVKLGMGKKDLLILSRSLNTDTAISSFHFSKKVESGEFSTKWLINAMGIPDTAYKYEAKYDDSTGSRIAYLRLLNDLEVTFKTNVFRKKLMFYKDEKIVFWKHFHHSYQDIVNEMVETGFEILHTSVSMDNTQVMLIAKLKQ